MGRRRAAMPDAVGDSFPTISSTGANAAIIHYQAAHGACSDIAAGAVYLCDTGGQACARAVHAQRTRSARERWVGGHHFGSIFVWGAASVLQMGGGG